MTAVCPGGYTQSPKAYTRPTGPIGTIFGPSAGKFIKMVEVLQNMDGQTDSQKNLVYRNLRQLVEPYQNVFYIRQVMDRVGEATKSALGD